MECPRARGGAGSRRPRAQRDGPRVRALPRAHLRYHRAPTARPRPPRWSRRSSSVPESASTSAGTSVSRCSTASTRSWTPTGSSSSCRPSRSSRCASHAARSPASSTSRPITSTATATSPPTRRRNAGSCASRSMSGARVRRPGHSRDGGGRHCRVHGFGLSRASPTAPPKRGRRRQHRGRGAPRGAAGRGHPALWGAQPPERPCRGRPSPVPQASRSRRSPERSATSGVAHRLQTVRDEDGVLWVNDSKATNVESAVAALRSFPGRSIVWIGGGKGAGTSIGASSTRSRSCAPRRSSTV